MTWIRRPENIFYGWVIVVAGFGLQLLNNLVLTRAFGSYVVLLQDEFGWSRTVTAGAYSLHQLENGLLGPIQGWLIDRFGPRATMRVGALLFGGGFILFSRIDSVLGFYAAFILIALGGSLCGFFPVSVTLINWFVRRRASAMGIMQTGMGVGGLLAPAIAVALQMFGWRTTAFASGVAIIVVSLPLIQLLRQSPERYGLLPDGDPPAPARPAQTKSTPGVSGQGGPSSGSLSQTDFTAREALRAGAFWYISIGHAAALLVVQAVNVHLVTHLHESLGYTIAEGTAIVSLLTAASMVGQLGGGLLGDRIDKRRLIVACMAGHAIALATVAFATALWMVIFFAVLHGLAWGVRGPLMHTLRADYFGRSSFGTILGFSSMIVMVGNISGPLLAGALSDHFGNYQAGFTVLAILAALGSVFWLLARKPVRRGV